MTHRAGLFSRPSPRPPLTGLADDIS